MGNDGGVPGILTVEVCLKGPEGVSKRKGKKRPTGYP